MGCCCNRSGESNLGRLETELSVATSENTVSGSDWVRLAWAGVAAAQGMILSLGLNVSDATGSTRWLLHGVMAAVAVAVALLAGGSLWRESWRAFRRRRVVSEQFFVLGIVAAFAISVQSTLRGHGPIYYEVVAVLVAIHALAGLLGGQRKREFERFRNAIREEFATCLLRVAPGEFERRPVREVQIGDVVLVPCGEAASVDGELLEGPALVEESALTGEPFPVVRRAGDVIQAGTIAADRALLMRVTASEGSRSLDDVLSAIETAGKVTGHLQRAADRLSSALMPVVMITATAALAFWWWHADFDTAVMRALAVIVVACPCAMGLATPIGVWGALAAFARNGLVARSGDIVERLAQVNEVIFDKTGTLSDPRPVLVDWIVAENAKSLPLRALVSAIEQRHDHPMAQALRFDERLPEGWVLESSRVLPGVGVEGSFQKAGGSDFVIRVGNSAVFDQDTAAITDETSRLRQAVRTEVSWSHEIWVTVNGKPAALALLREAPRPDAFEALERLERLGLRVSVLTGDREEGLRRLGLSLNGESNLSALQKVQRVGERQKNGARILYVGDGINDLAAMSRAWVSVAMGTGNRVAKCGASAVLHGGGLSKLGECITISRNVVRQIEGNMLIAICYNTVGILLAAWGIINPIVAAFLMLLSSATVSWRAFRAAHKLTAPTHQSHHKPPRKPRPDSDFTNFRENHVIVPQALAVVLSLAVWAQPPLLTWMAGIDAPFVTAMVFAGAFLSLAVWRVLISGPLRREMAWIAVMLASGNLGMLIGWCSEWGFAPLVREGMCLCGCAASPYGEGIGFGFSWMHLGMILGCAPIFLLRRSDGSVLWDIPTVGRCVFCFVGMWLGMGAGSLIVGSVMFSNEQIQFFANFGTMVCGMLLGMVIMEQLPKFVEKHLNISPVRVRSREF